MYTLLCSVPKEIPWRLLKSGQVQLKRSKESFTTIFRHWGQNSSYDFQLEVLQKPASKDVGGLDPCAFTSHTAVNPWQPEVIFSLVSPKWPLGNMLPFSCCKEEDLCLLGACAHLATGSTLPRMAWFLCYRGEISPLEAVMLSFPVSHRTVQTAGDTGEETNLQSEEEIQRLP